MCCILCGGAHRQVEAEPFAGAQTLRRAARLEKGGIGIGPASVAQDGRILRPHGILVHLSTSVRIAPVQG